MEMHKIARQLRIVMAKRHETGISGSVTSICINNWKNEVAVQPQPTLNTTPTMTVYQESVNLNSALRKCRNRQTHNIAKQQVRFLLVTAAFKTRSLTLACSQELNVRFGLGSGTAGDLAFSGENLGRYICLKRVLL